MGGGTKELDGLGNGDEGARASSDRGAGISETKFLDSGLKLQMGSTKGG